MRTNARTLSITTEVTITIRSSVPTSPSRPAFMASWAISLPRTPSLLLTMRASSDASVRVPRPPTKTPTRITSWPKKDQCTAVETTVKPVTQTADTAVKRASSRGVGCPVAEATGKDNKAVKTRITTAKAVSARRAGELLAMPSMKSRRRVKIHRPSRSRRLAASWPGSWTATGFASCFSSVETASPSSKPLNAASWPPSLLRPTMPAGCSGSLSLMTLPAGTHSDRAADDGGVVSSP